MDIKVGMYVVEFWVLANFEQAVQFYERVQQHSPLAEVKLITFQESEE
jgi:hypothetical protein